MHLRVPRLPALALLLLALGLLTACQRTPLLDRSVTAENTAAFGSWQRANRGDFTPEGWTEFEAIQQDIKVRIIALKEASGTEAVNEAMLAKINGRSVRAVLQQGLEARLWRLNVEREEFEKMLQGNSTLRTREGDTASADYLKRKRAEQEERLQRAKDGIRAVGARLKELAPGKN